MKSILVWITLFLVSCGKHETPPAAEAPPIALSPAQKSDAPEVTLGARRLPEDSVVDKGGVPGTEVLNGDTISRLGGHILAELSSKTFGVSQYVKNGTRYVRLQRLVGRKPDGMPVWLLLARFRLPQMDSTADWTDNMCQINGKPDHSVLAIASTVGKSPFPARHAWRFDQATEELTEIPTAGVTCYHAGMEEEEFN